MSKNQTFKYGRRVLFDPSGEPVPVELTYGESQVNAVIGHAKSGNTAYKLNFIAGVHSFKARGDGHILSLAPNQTLEKPVLVIFKTEQGDSFFEEKLVDSLDGIHIPGGTLVTLRSGADFELIDEQPSRARKNRPVDYDMIERTPLIKQGTDMIGQLKPGEYTDGVNIKAATSKTRLYSATDFQR